jgi:WhiB family redox-sensing transcriptional regulator
MNLEWMSKALCAEIGTEIFFPDMGDNPHYAKRVCRACIVRTECLQYALDTGPVYGGWGGTTERERRALRRSAVA